MSESSKTGVGSAPPGAPEWPQGTPEGRRVIQLLWEPNLTAPVRGPKPRTSLAEIVAAGISIADAEGLESLSMRKVAQQLGIGAMSVYTYVPGRSELIELMIDQVYSEHRRPDASKPWRDRVEHWSREAWRIYGLHPWLLDKAYTRLIRDVNVERTAFFIRAGLYLVFLLVLAACNLVFDYAKVRAVVEDRRSAFGAIAAALRFIRANLSATIALYLLNVALFALTLAAYAAVAPSAGGIGWTMWIGFAIGQLYILARLCVKLIFWASETSLFQGRLAHAGYVAAPKPVWPESPSAEAIQP